MKCPRCGQEIDFNKRKCEVCGTDFEPYDRLTRLSDICYNEGLTCARVRNLTGALEKLKKSLDINKENIKARNLYGLVLYEMGETVPAIVQWVISQNLNPDDTMSGYFLNKIHEDPVELDTINQSIKKYNNALESIVSEIGNPEAFVGTKGSKIGDLAIINLKRVVGMNPHYIRAMQLLATIHMRNNEYNKAKYYLNKILSIDVANTKALEYMNIIRLRDDKDIHGEKTSQPGGTFSPATERSGFEDKPNVFAMLLFFIGMAIGIATIYFLAVPKIKSNLKGEFQAKETNYQRSIAERDAEVHSKETDIQIMNDRIAELEKRLSGDGVYGSADYELLVSLLSAFDEYSQKEKTEREETNEMLAFASQIDSSGWTDEDAKKLYENVIGVLKKDASGYYFTDGLNRFNAGDDVSAFGLFSKALSFYPDSPEIMFYLARVNERMYNLEDAYALYNKIVLYYPEYERWGEAGEKREDLYNVIEAMKIE